MLIEIKLVGPTDDTYGKVHAAVQEAITYARQPVRLTTLADPTALRSHGIEVTPALLVNSQIKATGRVPAAREIVTWIMNAALEGHRH
jgi:hypothetical protein